MHKCLLLIVFICFVAQPAAAELYTIRFGGLKGKEVPDDCRWLRSVNPWGATKTIKEGIALSYHMGPNDEIKDGAKFGKPGGVRVELRNPTGEYASIIVYATVKDRSRGKAALCFRTSGGSLQKGDDFYGDGSHYIKATFKPRSSGNVNIWTNGNGDYLVERIDIIVKNDKR